MMAGPRRAAVYVRVSSEEQVEGYSLDAQVRATHLYCEAQGWSVVETYRDEGKSARTDNLAKRPAFSTMLSHAELGRFDVIVVHKLDRFARNLRVTLETLDRLERVGASFVSVNENMDFSTPMGRVVLSTMGSLSQFYSDNLSFETKKGKAERKAQGLYNGLLPFGVKKNSDGIPVPDPETYPGLLLAFRLAAEGKSDREVADALNAKGYRTTGNRGRNPFTKDTVNRLLKNRFYLGELPSGRGEWVQGLHQPVLDVELFHRTQVVRKGNRSPALHAARTRRRHSLSGLGVCGHCGGRLHVATYRHGEARIYCYQRTQLDTCPQRSRMLPAVEHQVAQHLARFHLNDDQVSQIIELYEQAANRQNDDTRRRLDIDGRLDRLRQLYAWGDLTEQAYLAERERLEAQRAVLAGTVDLAAVLAEAASYLRDLPSAWEGATPEQRNDLARAVFESIELTDDRVSAFVVRLEFVPFFRATLGVCGEDDDTAGGDQSPNGGVNQMLDEAEATGFEPAVSALTGLHVRPLHHASNRSSVASRHFASQGFDGGSAPITRPNLEDPPGPAESPRPR